MYQLVLLFSIFPPAFGSESTLSNAHIKLGAEVWPPFITSNKGENGEETYSGVLWDFVKYIQHARNITLTVVRPNDGQWGNCFGKNNCTGMIGMVQRKEVDFALGSAEVPFLSE